MGREREREREGEEERGRGREGERERGGEGERDRKREGERERECSCFIRLTPQSQTQDSALGSPTVLLSGQQTGSSSTLPPESSQPLLS